jgi:signal transduction histidine kinase
MAGEGGSLRKRIVLAVMLGMSIILLSFGIVSYLIVQKKIEDSLNKRLAFARLIRNNTDSVIKDNINRLYDISLSGRINLKDNDFGPEIDTLRTAYRYSIFTDGIFLLDMDGNVILNYPEKMKNIDLNLLSIEPISRILASGRPVVSDIYTTAVEKRKVIFALAPLKDKNGDNVGIVGGEIDPTNPILINMLRLTGIGENTFIDIIDSNGIVIASSKPSRMLTYCDHNKFFSAIISSKKERVAACHQCHDSEKKGKSTNIVAFVPLAMAPWGISIQEPREDVFAPSVQLRKTFAALGIIFVGTAFILAMGINKSIVHPIRGLIRAADRIAGGDLSKPIPMHSSDEIGILGSSFESMRMKLNESLESIKRHNLDLEIRVAERTAEIEHHRKRLAHLLNQLIKAQEDERKNVARELHDETAQLLAALGISIDMTAIAFKENALTLEAIDGLKQRVVHVLDGINLIIRGLRPPVLDDLGLESAVQWLFEKHLEEKGINYYLNVTEGFREAMSEYSQNSPAERKAELMLFRIIQEVINNINKHSHASNVFADLDCRDSKIQIAVEDDGIGFDVQSVLEAVGSGKDLGYGILGIQERVNLLDGKLTICSDTEGDKDKKSMTPCIKEQGSLRRGRLTIGPDTGGGTSVIIEVPLTSFRM